ncbi:hypothetical protein JTE90_023025 [Oedothorax gibbosus]|uniref:Uncharacterized protein n=1 Tax=Oedothorax gibbosus TaxID=931172 RepID=A0AAV6V2I8_9ARAC|nr:hypothetical protein JTE90_023025 [Oedothorax gibbosus]
MLELKFLLFFVASASFGVVLWAPGTYGEESDMPNDVDPVYKFYEEVIRFLTAIADFVYFRLFGSQP